MTDKALSAEIEAVADEVERRFSSGRLLLSFSEYLDLFSQEISVQAAPFIDAGRVFHSIGQNPVSGLHPAGGIGLRAIARPFIVGYVDVGYGAEGVAIFSGINYPF